VGVRLLAELYVAVVLQFESTETAFLLLESSHWYYSHVLACSCITTV
jgi:hypothetical protein